MKSRVANFFKAAARAATTPLRSLGSLFVVLGILCVGAGVVHAAGGGGECWGKWKTKYDVANDRWVTIKGSFKCNVTKCSAANTFCRKYRYEGSSGNASKFICACMKWDGTAWSWYPNGIDMVQGEQSSEYRCDGAGVAPGGQVIESGECVGICPPGYAPVCTEVPVLTYGPGIDSGDWSKPIYREWSCDCLPQATNYDMIAASVFRDSDKDGKKGVGELPIGGCGVELRQPGSDGIFGTSDDVIYPSQTTDSSGSVEFSGLDEGFYRVEIDELTISPSGMMSSTGGSAVAVMLWGSESPELHFGYEYNVPGASLSGLVFTDYDADGTQSTVPEDREFGQGGIVLQITEAGPDATLDTADDVELADAVTLVNGTWSVPNLTAGTYRVVLDADSLPDGATVTTGSSTLIVVLTTSQSATGLDFGYDYTPGEDDD